MFESSQPITSGRENGVDRCTTTSAVCANGKAIDAANAQKAAAVSAISNAALSGDLANVTVVGNSDKKCGDGSVTGVASRGGNISCDDKLAGQRANKEAMDIALKVQEQVAGQGIHVQVVNSSGKNVSGGGTTCVPSAKVICIFATGAGNLSGRKQADVALTTTPPAVPRTVQVTNVDACLNIPGDQPAGTNCTVPPTTVPPTTVPPTTVPPTTVPPTTVTPTTVTPTTVTPTTVPSGTVPSTTVPSGTVPPATVPQPPKPVRPS